MTLRAHTTTALSVLLTTLLAIPYVAIIGVLWIFQMLKDFVVEGRLLPFRWPVFVMPHHIIITWPKAIFLGILLSALVWEVTADLGARMTTYVIHMNYK